MSTAPAARTASTWTALLAVGLQVAGVVGLVLYVQGHGIHLAANSIAERQDSPTAFFWDELAGHALWYAGLYLLLGALLVGRAVATPPGPVRLVLSVAVDVLVAAAAGLLTLAAVPVA